MSYRCWNRMSTEQQEVGINDQNGQVMIVITQIFWLKKLTYFKAIILKRKKVRWEPKISLEELVLEMFEHASNSMFEN